MKPGATDPANVKVRHPFHFQGPPEQVGKSHSGTHTHTRQQTVCVWDVQYMCLQSFVRVCVFVHNILFVIPLKGVEEKKKKTSSAGNRSLRVNYPALNLRSPLFSPSLLPASHHPLLL